MATRFNDRRTAAAVETNENLPISFGIGSEAFSHYASLSTPIPSTLGLGRVIDLSSVTTNQGFIIQWDAAGYNAGYSVSSAGDGIDDLIVGTPDGDDRGYNDGQAYVIYGQDGASRGLLDLSTLSASRGFVIQRDRGDFLSGEFLVNGNISGRQNYPSIASHDNALIYTWSDQERSGSNNWQVVARSFELSNFNVGDRSTPVITSNGGGAVAAISIPENTTAMTTVTATDADANTILTYTISGGADAALFAIDAATGVLSFRAAPDFEAPSDAGADNVYDVEVQVSDGTLTDKQTLAVTVSNVVKELIRLDLPAGPVTGSLHVTGDDNYQVFVNGSFIGTDNGDGWPKAESYNVTLNHGLNVIAIKGINTANGTHPGAVIADLNLSGYRITTDRNWLVQSSAPEGWNAPEFDPTGWIGATQYGDITSTVWFNRGGLDGSGVTLQGAGFPLDSDAQWIWSKDLLTDREVYFVRYVYVGDSSTPVIDLSTLTTSQGFVIQGNPWWEQAGLSVSDAGDVNSDGIDDVIVGAPYGSRGAYVIYGQTGASRGLIDLSTLSASQGFVIQGFAAGDMGIDVASETVSGAGDVNGDGIDDLIVGAPGGDDGGTNAGQAYVIYGQAGASRGLVDVSTLSASQGFVIQGDVAGDLAGWSVSDAGDVNGDGLDDLIVGARGIDDGSDASVGAAYVIYGQAGASRGRLDLTELSASEGFVILGAAREDIAGDSVSSAGDVNGDGIDDLIVGAPNGRGGGVQAGETYVIYGQAGTSRGRLDLGMLSASQGFVIQGDVESDESARTVSDAGDVNGDGIDDLIVSAPRGDDGGQDTGEAYVIYGQAGTSRGRIDLSALSPSEGFIIQGKDPGAWIGFGGLTASSAGDVNGDGIDDLIVGSPLGDDGGLNAGQAYVIYGQAGTSRGRLDLGTLSSSEGFVMQGHLRNSLAGFSVSSAGDVNRDGLDDLIVGGTRIGESPTQVPSETYVIYGFRNTSTVPTIPTVTGTAGNDQIYGTSGDDVINGLGGNDIIDGGAGRDILRGGQGDDIYFVDTIDDVLQEFGGQGRDIVYTTVSFRLREADDIELLFADPRGGTSALNLAGNGIANLIFGNDGANILEGGGGDDALYGYLGNDTLNGGLGVDTMAGGLGDDIYFIDTIDDVLQEFGGQGRDLVYTNVSFRLRETNDIELLVADPRLGTSALNLAGNGIANLIFGNDGVNILEGGGGDDALFGYLGNDTLNGGTGVDTLVGGLGDDTYFVDTIDDVLQEFAGQGRDTVYTTVNFRLRDTDDIELLIADPRGGTSALNLAGNGIANLIFGNDGVNILEGGGGDDALFGYLGNDTLNGGLGVDTMVGGLGDDIYFVDTIDDVLQEFSGEGRDIVYTTVNFRLRETDDIELLVADPRLGTSALNLAGNGIANLIFGNDGVNILEGGGGNDALYGYLGNDTLNGGLGVDTMVGGLGDDIYFVDTIDDILQEFSGQGRDFVYSTVSYRLRASDDIEVLLADPRASTAAINLTGNDLVNSLIGNAGANILDGKGGNDFLTGNEGADSFGFSTALNGVSNVDTILGFSVTEDRVLLGAGGGQPFSGLTVGVLASGAFATGSAATTADHRIIYNAADGSLFFDADGSGAGTAIQFANIGVGLALTASHFTVTGTLAGAPEPTSKGAAADPQVLPGVADDGFVILAKDSDAPLVLPGADGFDDFADPDVLVPPMPLNQMLTIGDNGELISGSGGLGGRHDHDGWLF